MDVFGVIIVAVLALIAGAAGGYLYRKKVIEEKIGRSEALARKTLDDAVSAAESKKKESILAAKEEIMALRGELDEEVKSRRAEVSKSEQRLAQKEDTIDKREETLEKREASLEKKLDEQTAKENALAKRTKEVEKTEAAANELYEKQAGELERISHMTMDEAREIIIERVKQDALRQSAASVREIIATAKTESDMKAREIISEAIQRCASDHVSETTISSVSLPNDEMKGRIIGREGRNIKSLEAATGVDLIIDDTPESVTISSFDPVRREIARRAIERMVNDGRFNPARIEEMVEKATAEVDTIINEAGQDAIFSCNIANIDPELVKLLGRLKFRYSYGQNVLQHSIEVSKLAGIMAAELGANVQIAKRGGLLHDIGKAIDREVEGTHISIGFDLAKKYNEKAKILNCIQAHHGDVEPTCIEAVLVQAADAISAARPGARRENIEAYIKRLEDLERIAASFPSVEKAYALQAGREVRVIVKPEDVKDEGMDAIGTEISKQIEEQLTFPGTIKVTIIRETRITAIAK